MKRRFVTMTHAFVGLLILIAAFVMVERFGIVAGDQKSAMEELPQAYLASQIETIGQEKESLLLVDESEVSQIYTEQITYVLTTMDVDYDVYTIKETDSEPFPDLQAYQTVVLSSVQMDHLMNQGGLEEIMDWVRLGGRFLTIIPNAYARAMSEYQEEFGLLSFEPGEITVEQMEIQTDFMVGSKGFQYDLEGFSTYAMNVKIAEGSTVHIMQEKTDTPIVWETELGEGRIVVNNIDMFEKTTRGMLAAEYSLLLDVFAYPVINSSVYFIDDFPAPFPEGHHESISRFYDMDVPSFFANIWLPDIMKISRDYEIPFTNMMINTYKNSTAPPYNEPVDKHLFTFYGNLLLSLGGEIGYHGYNHQPLVLDDFPLDPALGYQPWESTDNMMEAMNTLAENTKWLFPNQEVSVYVPPSNILSSEARERFTTDLPGIKTISGLYVVTGNEYEQEFTVAPDGIVELPRTVSGLDLSIYDQWLGLNELTFHYVNSIFFHPDDLLDKDRGADKGWEYLKEKFLSYLDWLEEAAPELRHQKASDAARAVQRYHVVELKRIEGENEFRMEIENFYDQFYGMVRIREDRIQSVTGGKLTSIGGELYLLEASEATVTITFE
ncbi:DUF2194 domain-containing protein [Jeotgalibaca caeni]|uniref:DUF2194 domain-containing protein n=1 Tax=Jeotgalibaca caeni TaxID=3028623 RepID=UPI00237D35E7|nr:DUF2194 domain-containing protein [Jeotgalibaca caeni]MDE1548249.1 DUF2194 domain-containing protein [Jeotgalibaca caeni]